MRRAWSPDDASLYALGVGAGVEDLAFTTDDTAGIAQQVLPTMAVVLSSSGFDALDLAGDIDRMAMLHAEQSIELHRPIPPSGELEETSTVAAVFDKGAHALLVIATEATDAASGQPLFTNRSTAFLRGAGGWGGERGPEAASSVPADRAPDHRTVMRTDPNQALLYRLSGDRNPLHSDPAFAARAGFDRPILHGLCTYGFTGRALLADLCGGDPAAFRSMSGRFTSTVHPGDTLVVEVWRAGPGEAAFRTLRGDGTVVIDGGTCRFGAVGS